MWKESAPDCGEKAAKDGLNAMFGVWGIYESAKYKAFTTDQPGDVSPYGEPHAVKYVTKLILESETFLNSKTTFSKPPRGKPSRSAPSTKSLSIWSNFG